MHFLQDNVRDSRLNEVVMALCAEALIVSGVEDDHDSARNKANDAVVSGEAAEIFDRMVSGLGGPANFVRDHAKHLPAGLSRAQRRRHRRQ